MIRKIRGTVVVITGATSGIGRATALEFAREGASVVVAGRREARLRELVAEIEVAGGEALAVRCDVSVQAQVEHLMAQAIDRFGRIDTLVNNAGVGLAAKFTEQSIEDFRRLMDVNFWGAVYACQAVVPQMKGRAAASSSMSRQFSANAECRMKRLTPPANSRSPDSLKHCAPN